MQRAASSEREAERLRQQLQSGTGSGPAAGPMKAGPDMERALDMLSRSNLEVELAAKEKEVSSRDMLCLGGREGVGWGGGEGGQRAGCGPHESRPGHGAGPGHAVLLQPGGGAGLQGEGEYIYPKLHAMREKIVEDRGEGGGGGGGGLRGSLRVRLLRVDLSEPRDVSLS